MKISFFVFQEWFSRQQLMLVVLFVNVTLAIVFFKSKHLECM